MADAILAQSGIYAITNKANGKIYVGSAVLLRRRFRKHVYELSKGTHHSVKLQRAWAKYGKDSFEFAVLEVVEAPVDLVAREQHWMGVLQAYGDRGYNMAPTAGSILGIKRSQQTIEKMRASGRRYVASPETREKLRLASTGKKASAQKLEKMRRLVKSPETLEKLRIASSGRKMSPEAIQKWKIANAGKPKSEAAKEKMRLAKVGKKWTDAQRAAIMAARSDPAFIAKINATRVGRKQSAETVAKRVDSARRTREAKKAAMTPSELEARRLSRKQPAELIARRTASIKLAYERKRLERLAI